MLQDDPRNVLTWPRMADNAPGYNLKTRGSRLRPADRSPTRRSHAMDSCHESQLESDIIEGADHLGGSNPRLWVTIELVQTRFGPSFK